MTAATGGLRARRLPVVEDDDMIADFAQALEERGFEAIGPWARSRTRWR